MQPKTTLQNAMPQQPEGRAPGIYFGLSNEEYHADPAISSSGIKKLLKSPLEYWHESPLNPSREKQAATPSMKFGTAYHTLVLEPEKFDYEVIPNTKTTSKEGCLAEAEYAQLNAMKAQLQSIDKHRFLFMNGYAEVSIFWRDETTGLMCKCRYDYWKPGYITDLKTIDDIHSGIRYDVPKFGYDVSGAMYMEGARALKRMLRSPYKVTIDGDTPNDARLGEFLNNFVMQKEEYFVFLFQAKKAPYITRGLPIAPDTASVGKEKFERGLSIYRECIELYGPDVPWPTGYDDFEDMTLDQLSSSINYV